MVTSQKVGRVPTWCLHQITAESVLHTICNNAKNSFILSKTLLCRSASHFRRVKHRMVHLNMSNAVTDFICVLSLQFFVYLNIFCLLWFCLYVLYLLLFLCFFFIFLNSYSLSFLHLKGCSQKNIVNRYNYVSKRQIGWWEQWNTFHCIQWCSSPLLLSDWARFQNISIQYCKRTIIFIAFHF